MLLFLVRVYQEQWLLLDSLSIHSFSDEIPHNKYSTTYFINKFCRLDRIGSTTLINLPHDVFLENWPNYERGDLLAWAHWQPLGLLWLPSISCIATSFLLVPIHSLTSHFYTFSSWPRLKTGDLNNYAPLAESRPIWYLAAGFNFINGQSPRRPFADPTNFIVLLSWFLPRTDRPKNVLEMFQDSKEEVGRYGLVSPKLEEPNLSAFSREDRGNRLNFSS